MRSLRSRSLRFHSLRFRWLGSRSLGSRWLRSHDGQATVELVALLPLVGLLAALAWQLLLAGEAWWLSGAAARAAARAAAIGTDPAAAARDVLPRRFERGLRVRLEPEGAVVVGVRVPAALGGGALTFVTTRAHFEAQR